MTAPSPPAGYNVAKHVNVSRLDCQVTVGFDRQQSHIPCFLVQLHYQTSTNPVRWKAIARMDHNETSVLGHDVYREGLHVDIARRSGGTVHLHLSHGALPSNRGVVIRNCVDYLDRESKYFIDVYEERRAPGGPPGWQPDGGDPTPTFICVNSVSKRMSRESPAEEPLSDEELTEFLAESTGVTPEELERRADELDIEPPNEATIVDE